MTLITISDSSIFIHLATINSFNLLKSIFKRITIPQEVYTEVVERGWGLPGSLETAEAYKDGWIILHSVVNKESIREIAMKYKINYANAEVVQLARESNPDMVLADEEEVRTACQHFGFYVKGCLGILLEGVKKKIISEETANNNVEQLIESGYRIDNLNIKIFKDTLRRILEK